MPYRRLGSSDRLSTTVRDVNGNLADPGDIALRLRDPAGAVSTIDYNPGPIVRDGQGLFHYDVANLTTLGDYAWLYKTTGANQGVAPNPRYFRLVDEFTPVTLTLDEAKSQLNASAPDADLELYVDSAIETQEEQIGPVVPRVVTRTAVVSYDRRRLLLPTRIVAGSITAATANDAAVGVTGWTADADMPGAILLPAGTSLYGAVKVTYTAGFDPIPIPLKEAAALRVQHSYETQRGPAELPLTEAAEGGGSAFILLLRAQDKEAPYLLPVVA